MQEIRRALKKQRKLRIFLNSGSFLYRFCWLKFLIDGSLSFGLSSKSIKFTELGQAICSNGKIVSHTPFLTDSANSIDSKSLHLTFHPPSKHQSIGTAHFVHSHSKAKEWPLSWFPVIYPKLLFSVNVTAIDHMAKTSQPKEQHHVVKVPRHLTGFEMRVLVVPRSTNLQRNQKCSAFDILVGYCPDYLAIAKFYESNLDVAAIYVSMDQVHNKRLHSDGRP